MDSKHQLNALGHLVSSSILSGGLAQPGVDSGYWVVFPQASGQTRHRDVDYLILLTRVHTR